MLGTENRTTNDYNIMQHPQILHKNLTFFKFEPTSPNMLQHAATLRNRVAKREQDAANNIVTICWVVLPGLYICIFVVM